MDLVTRADAAAAGIKHFFTGRLCKNGHISQRFVSTGGCAQCQNQYSRKARAAQEMEGFLPAQHLHPEDRNQVLALIDYLNHRRGLPAAVRPGDGPRLPSDFEQFVANELRKPVTIRPPLDDIERVATQIHGFTYGYQTMARPTDTWSWRHLRAPALRTLDTSSDEVMRANAAHNAALGMPAPGSILRDPNAALRALAAMPTDVAARKAEFARELEQDGYLDDEKKT